MTKYEVNQGNVNFNQPSYICAKTEFTQTTDAEDGSVLIVVDETTHTVDKYCIAFNKNWNEL